MDIPERYVRLCLRLGRHVDGFVDAYFGPPELKERIDSEAPVEPRGLEEEAATLAALVADAGFDDQRARWLTGQLSGLECVASRLAGDDVAWGDEVERCFGIRPQLVDTSVFEEMHRLLDEALPGGGNVRTRYLRWEKESAVERDMLVPALDRLKQELRERARDLVPLPAEEDVDYELVSGEPWLAYNWYQGGYRSRVEINADLPISIDVLTDLAAHEAYPGHHTERAGKEAHLYRDLGRLENSVVVVSAPESLVSEGIAMNALEVALGAEPFPAIAAALADIGVKFDVEAAAAMRRAEKTLFEVGTNVAILIHEQQMSEAEAGEYLRDWGLLSDQKADRLIRFVSDPPWHAYTSAYTDGYRLCLSFIERDPGNFARLLTEQLTTADLLP